MVSLCTRSCLGVIRAMHAHTVGCVCTSSFFYSSLGGVVKLKFACSAPLDMCFCLVSCLAKVKIFRFWLKTMDYRQVF